MAQTSAVAVDEFLYHLVVRHLNDGRHAFEPVYIHFLFEYGVHVFHTAVVVLVEICLRHVEVQEAVEFKRHRFGEFNHLFLTLFVGNGDFILVSKVFFNLCLYGNIACQQQGC